MRIDLHVSNNCSHHEGWKIIPDHATTKPRLFYIIRQGTSLKHGNIVVLSSKYCITASGTEYTERSLSEAAGMVRYSMCSVKALFPFSDFFAFLNRV